MWPEIKRKFFHLGGLIYVAGLFLIPRPVYLGALVPLLALEFLGEMARLKNPAIGRWFAERFGGLLRESEKLRFSGVFWMLAGVTGTVLLVPPIPLAAASLLYLIVGDVVASLAGMRFGGPHWPASNKRLTGSLACFLACLIIGGTLLRPGYGWHGIVVGALVATICELGLIPVNDNFLIPVGSAAALLLCYGARPFF